MVGWPSTCSVLMVLFSAPMRVLAAALFLLPLSACDSGGTPDPAPPVPAPYTVHYQASKEGRGRVDTYTLAYTDANGQTAFAPEGSLPGFDRTFTVPAGSTVTLKLTGIYRVDPAFPSATLNVRIDATRDGQTLSDSDLQTAQGTRAENMDVEASVVLPR